MPHAPSPLLSSLRLAAAVLVVGVGLAVGAARAGDAGLTDDKADDVTTPQKAEAILARQGYVGVADLRRRGGVWLADVTERNGRRWRAVLDVATGEVAGLRPLPSPPPARPVIGMQTSER
ncbi:MAG: PepSY domain-containing protein [Alsobacter sp.]